MDKFKALSLVLLGMVIGLGYAVACGSGDDDDATTMPAIPGVGLAMAQSGCAQWEVMTLVFDDTFDGFVGSLPAGWSPLGGHTNFFDGLWLARCAQ